MVAPAIFGTDFDDGLIGGNSGGSYLPLRVMGGGGKRKKITKRRKVSKRRVRRTKGELQSGGGDEEDDDDLEYHDAEEKYEFHDAEGAPALAPVPEPEPVPEPDDVLMADATPSVVQAVELNPFDHPPAKQGEPGMRKHPNTPLHPDLEPHRPSPR
mgnify:CR=1 FL=1